MSYPFGPQPRLSQLCERLRREFDCKIEDFKLTRSDGYSPKMLVIDRTVDGELMRAVLECRDRELAPSAVRSVLDRLRVPLESFDLEWFKNDLIN